MLSTRQRREAPVGLGKQADPFDGRADGLAVVAPERSEQSRARSPACRDELAHRQGRVDARDRALREVAEMSRKQLYAAGHRLLETEDEPQEGGLAAAVRPGDRDELPLADLEGDVAKDQRTVPVRERDMVEANG